MSSEKKYSLISVDVADDEEVIHVGAPTSAGLSSAQKSISGKSAESESVDESIQQTLEDLDAPVPFANMQKIVLVVLALLVIAFVIYWFTMHGA